MGSNRELDSLPKLACRCYAWDTLNGLNQTQQSQSTDTKHGSLVEDHKIEGHNRKTGKKTLPMLYSGGVRPNLDKGEGDANQLCYHKASLNYTHKHTQIGIISDVNMV